MTTSGKVADIANCSSSDGTDIRQWSWLNNNCQRFRLIYTGGDYVRITNVSTGKVADVANCGTGNGVDVRQWSWLNNTASSGGSCPRPPERPHAASAQGGRHKRFTKQRLGS